MLRKIIFIITLSLQTVVFGVETLTLKEVQESTLKYFPEVIQAIDKAQMVRNSARAAEGAFDAKVVGKGDVRTEGYYDGRVIDTKVVKPLRYLNSELYVGHRDSEGIFPSYEGKSVTGSDGELRAGVTLSLWKNARLDPRRFEFFNALLETQNAENQLELKKLKARLMGQYAYWEWVALGKMKRVYQELLDMALDRTDGLNERIKRGDLARIYAVENEQYILKRQQKLNKVKAEFERAKFFLSLFYRDSEGKRIVPQDKRIPDAFALKNQLEPTQVGQALSRVLERHPKLIQIKNKIEMTENKVLLSKNSLMPKLDLTLEVSDDRGSGSKTITERENRVYLSFEVPLERNLGKGKVAQAMAKKRILLSEFNYQREQIEIKIKSLVAKIKASRLNLGLTDKEISLARQLLKSELIKFDQGASDYFVINIREQNLADAQLKRIQTAWKLNQGLAKYYAQTLDWNAF